MTMRRYKLHDGSSINVIAARYHRNGVGGAGFSVVRFEYDGQALLGIVPDNDEEDQRENIAVVNPLDIADTKRGADWFGPALIRAVKAFPREPYSGNTLFSLEAA